MNAETLRELLQRKPFEPFAIRMSNGDVFRVSHPEVALLLKTKIVIGDPDNDRSWTCALLHINAIETQQAA
jgi:hypothetical protein